jgi:hypothetical protein
MKPLDIGASERSTMAASGLKSRLTPDRLNEFVAQNGAVIAPTLAGPFEGFASEADDTDNTGP